MTTTSDGSAIVKRLMDAFLQAFPHARKSHNALGKWCGLPGYNLRRAKNGERSFTTDELNVIASQTGLSPIWISTGQEPRYQVESTKSGVVTSFLTSKGLPPSRSFLMEDAAACGQTELPSGQCLRCQALERELELERAERRDQARELRELHHQLRALLRENGDLRASLAFLEGKTGIQPDSSHRA